MEKNKDRCFECDGWTEQTEADRYRERAVQTKIDIESEAELRECACALRRLRIIQIFRRASDKGELSKGRRNLSLHDVGSLAVLQLQSILQLAVTAVPSLRNITDISHETIF